MGIAIVRNGMLILRANGEIDIANACELESALNILLSERPKVLTVDISELSFIDGAGIRLILSSALRQSSHGGRLFLVTRSPLLRRVLVLLHADELPGLAVYQDLDSLRHDLGLSEGSDD